MHHHVLPLCLKNPKREKHKLKSLKRLNSSGEFTHFKYRARPYNQLKRASSDIKGSARRLPLLSRPGTRPMHEKRNERERYEWEQWSMANPWRTRGDRNSRWKDTVVGAYRRHRWAQKARKRPVAIRLAGWDRRWHRTKLESTASVAVRIERGKRREGERKKGERERACVPVSIVGRQSLNGRGTRAMNEERA